MESVILSFMSLWQRLKAHAQQLTKEVLAVWIAARDPRTPWYAKAVSLIVTAYAFSPIDLIPDFIPVLGVLDDLLLIPAGVALSIKLIPSTVLQEAREKAKEKVAKPVSWPAGILIGLLWLVIILLLVRLLFNHK